MIGFFRRLLGGGTQVDFAELVRHGARIIDVRTKAEFSSGHARGSVNIPLDQLDAKAASLNKDAVIIVCCRSGSRSASAERILRSKGFRQVYNAGSWTTLRKITNKKNE